MVLVHSRCSKQYVINKRLDKSGSQILRHGHFKAMSFLGKFQREGVLGGRARHPQICHFGMRMILHSAHLRNSESKDTLTSPFLPGNRS